jgi:glycosyltransferase involved in cell wall biosynthesis
MVLTSVSEAQPLVILEAGAVGVPVVSTDVGACSELIIGRGSHSRSLGAGGHLTPIASPGATAAAVLVLHDDRELRLRMGQSLQRRVQQYFDQQVMTDSYRAVYQDLLQPEVV